MWCIYLMSMVISYCLIARCCLLQILYYYSQGFSTVTCGKTRDENRRQITIQVSDGEVECCRCTQARVGDVPVKAHITHL